MFLIAFRANEARLQLSVLTYNLGNLYRRLVLSTRSDTWSLTSLQQRLVKTGGWLVKHARYYWLLLAESHLTRHLFGSMRRKSARPSTFDRLRKQPHRDRPSFRAHRMLNRPQGSS